MHSLTFVPMQLSNVASIGVMERRNYEFPWTDGIFRDCVKAGYHCIKVMLKDELIGYAVVQIAADEAHILNLCIDKIHQKKGFARALLGYLLQLAAAQGAISVFLEVRPSNPRAVQLYEQSGFNEVGLRKNYYDSANGREDAIVMAISVFANHG